MNVNLAYGDSYLTVDLPDNSVVLEPDFIPAVQDPVKEIKEALNHPINSKPLKQLVSSGDKVVIVHSDITRATPNHIIQPIIVAELEKAGIKRENISFLNALGTHRPQTPDELVKLLGADISKNYLCLQHDCNDDNNLVEVGTTSFGHKVRLNKKFMAADIKILTGFIEPHFFAGFSGGPKGILPSIAGLESVVTNHSPKMIAHPNAAWGVTEGNPIWEEMMEAAQMAKPTFLVNVALNKNKQITAVCAGALREAHKRGTEFCRKSAMVPVNQKFDVVITTNSGYPLDLNLYQSIKGVNAAASIVKKGGTIILVSECREGLPEFGKYAELLRSVSSPREALDKIMAPGFHEHDQWQVQVQAEIQLEADIFVYSDGLTATQIRDALLQPVDHIETLIENLQKKYGSGMSIAVLPEGPQVIPYLRS